MTRVNASTISFEWYDNIHCQQRNSDITIGLQIRLVQNGYSKTLLHNATSISQEGQQYTLNWTWPSPGFLYEISIAAVNAMGQAGSYSNQLSIQLPHYNGKIEFSVKNNIQFYTYKQHFMC